MDTRTREYIARKKAFETLPKQTDIKSLLKASFFAAKNIVVKKDILKTYENLNQFYGAGTGQMRRGATA